MAKKVYVGMSGGVDSSVSAALLVKAGFDVTGVFIKVWQPDWLTCNWREERLDAMRAAAHIGIPFVTLDLEKEYKKGVIDYMIEEYRLGRTPNPDVMCNREVKFGAFWKWAKEQGADYIATGHYAQNISNELHVSKDSNKDQSYFLWTLTADDLQHVMFPVGHLVKSEVRKLATKFKLPNADKKDSQGLCFIGKVDVKEFLSHYIETKPGNVLNTAGKVIGNHPGALFLTVGERHGFNITEKTPEDAPYFIVSKDIENNTLTVSNKATDKSLPNGQKEVRLSNVNWIGTPPKDDTNAVARSRYRAPLYLGKVLLKPGDVTKAAFQFEAAQDTLTPGQSLVIYDGSRCLGGGIIV